MRLDHKVNASVQHGSAHDAAGTSHKHRTIAPRRNRCTESPGNKQEKREFAGVYCTVKPRDLFT